MTLFARLKAFFTDIPEYREMHVFTPLFPTAMMGPVCIPRAKPQDKDKDA